MHLTHQAVVIRLRAAGCVFAEDEARLLLAATTSAAALQGLLEQRVSGLPLEHVLGWAQFCGGRIQVDPTVFVPRRRTELLVREAVALTGPRDLVVDLCCGSGAIGAALLAARPDLELYAVDVDPAAVRCARRNVRGTVLQGDLFAALPDRLRGSVQVVVANAPYVPTHAIAMLPPEARLHEPRVALDGGADGLDVQRRIAEGVPRWLAPGGHLLVETSEDQGPGTAEAFATAGLAVRVARDEALDAVVVIGTAAV